MTTTPPSAPAAAVSNVFLAGPFAPVTEEVTVTDLPVTGAIPEFLDGRYLRNGSNPIDIDIDPASYHWFTGDGMVHGIRLRGGRAEWYRNRWVRTVEVSEALGERSHTGNVYLGLVQPPNTNVIGHGGRFYAVAESGVRPYELDGDLDTVGPCTFDGTLPGGYTAHAHRDPDTGELHAVSYFIGEGKRLTYQYSVLGTDGRFNRVVDLDIAGSPAMHDFALAEDHVVLLDLPVAVEVHRLGLEDAHPAPITGPHADSRGIPISWDPASGRYPVAWDPDAASRIGLLPRRGAEAVRWFEIEPCYVFHPLNAYEERATPDGPVERVIVDVVRFPTMFTTAAHQGPDNMPTLDRWTLDLTTGTLHEERLDDRPQEFPRLDERLVGRRHRYGYTAGFMGLVLKRDYDTGTTAVHPFEPGDFVSEFVFVAAAPDAGEDEGVLMGLVSRAATGTSDLVMLDAGTLEPVATVHLPVRVPAGFHGNWIPA